MPLVVAWRDLALDGRRLAAGQIAPQEIARLRARAEAVLALPEDAPIPAAAEDEDLHLLIADAAGNPVLEELILGLRTRTSMFRFGRFPSRRRCPRTGPPNENGPEGP